MDDAQNTGSVQEAMTVEDAAQQTEEVSAETLYENLMKEPEEEAPAQEEQEEEPQEPELTPEERQRQAVMNDIQTLMDDGLSGEDLNEMIQDSGVRADVKGGKTFRQAVMAYLRRQSAAQRPAAKRGVPTAKAPATAGAKNTSAIEEMSDEEFARFSEQATRLARQGKRVTIR